MKTYKYKNRSKKPFILTVFYLLLVVLLMILVKLTRVNEEKESMRLIAIKQGSKKVKYYKEVNGELINIDKVTLEKLMNKYNVVLEEIPNEKWI